MDIIESSLSTGTDVFALNGPEPGCDSFDTLKIGEVVFYRADFGEEWEEGLGTLVEAGKLARSSILASSNSNLTVDFAPGKKLVKKTRPESIMSLVGALAAAMNIKFSDVHTALDSKSAIGHSHPAANLPDAPPVVIPDGAAMKYELGDCRLIGSSNHEVVIGSEKYLLSGETRPASDYPNFPENMVNPVGMSWSKSPSEIPPPGMWNYGSPSFANGKFFIALPVGVILSSPDGRNWSTSYIPGGPHSQLNQSVVYGAGKYLLTSQDGFVATSANGTDWDCPATRSIPAASGGFSDAFFGNGAFICSEMNIDSDSGVSSHAAISSNGVNWTLRTVPGAFRLNGAIAAFGKFFVFGQNGVFVSDDGISWAVAGSTGLDGNCSKMLYVDGSLYALIAGLIYKTTDGVAWTKTNIKNTFNFIESSGPAWFGVLGNALSISTNEGLSFYSAGSVVSGTPVFGNDIGVLIPGLGGASMFSVPSVGVVDHSPGLYVRIE